jgi:polygalacturonase
MQDISMLPSIFVRPLVGVLLTSASLLSFAAPSTNFDSLLPAEPTLPTKVCIELPAALTATKGVLPDTIDSDPTKSSPDSARLQAAINQCPAGSAVKLITDGTKNAFLSGPFTIASGVTLWVDKGVTLFASRSPKDYDLGDGICGTAQPKIKNRCESWINAKNTVNSGIVGEGTLDARGGAVLTSGSLANKTTWWDLSMQSKASPKLEQNNPRMIQISGGKNFTFYKITLSNSPKFHVGTTDLDGMTLWGIKLLTPSLAYTNPGYKCAEGTYPTPGKLDKPSSCFYPEVVKNTDGVDPGTSSNVTLAYSFISTGDDNVAIKSGESKRNPATTNHLYAHNYFYYGHGMSIGSETNAGVKGIKVWGLVLDGMDSGHGVGIRIKSDGKRGGEISDVIYQDVCMRRVKDSLVFSPYYDKTDQTNLPPNMHDITLRNFHYVNAPKAKYNKSLINMSGYAEAGIVNTLKVTLDNVVFDTTPGIRDAEFHDIEFTYGPGKVVNFPMKKVDTVKVIDKQQAKSTELACLDSVFVPFPSEASPF